MKESTWVISKLMRTAASENVPELVFPHDSTCVLRLTIPAKISSMLLLAYATEATVGAALTACDRAMTVRRTPDASSAAIGMKMWNELERIPSEALRFIPFEKMNLNHNKSAKQDNSKGRLAVHIEKKTYQRLSSACIVCCTASSPIDVLQHSLPKTVLPFD
jgi:hypothetical protein